MAEYRKLELNHYHEDHPRRFMRICWALVNMLIFPLLPKMGRLFLLRLFGAKIVGQTLIYRSVKIFAPWNFEMGDWGCIGPRAEIYCKDKIMIGSHVIISQDAYLCTASHDVSSSVMALKTRPVTIGDCAWVAARAIVLPGVTLGDGAVVGCAAVVTHDVAPWSVVGGNPAKFIKKREIKS